MAGEYGYLDDSDQGLAAQVNYRNMLYLTNGSGAQRESGDVVIDKTATGNNFTTTTTPGDPRVIGVVARKYDQGTITDQTIANLANGWIQQIGYIDKVKVDGAASVGDYLKASSTAAKATPTSVKEQGVFAVATSASSTVVSAILFPAISLQMSAGVYPVGTEDGANRRMEFGRIAWGAGATSDGYYEYTLTFTTAFNTAPNCVISEERDSNNAYHGGYIINEVTTTQLKIRMYRYAFAYTTYCQWLAIGN